MNLFFDTSSLVKLYHDEKGTKEISEVLNSNIDDLLFLSKLSIIEFSSALWKKVWVGDLSKEDCLTVINLFESDLRNFQLLSIDDDIIRSANLLLLKYGNKGLRTLDSIQFSSALILQRYDCINVVSDKLLVELFISENLRVF